MAITVTIGGVGKNLQRNTLEISKTANGRSTALFSITSKDASYRPVLDQAVVITNGATTEFAGLIDRVTEKGVVAGASAAIELEVNCGDYQGYADRRFVKATIPTGTLKAALTVLVTYLSAYGVTLDGAQVNGPTLPELTYQYRQLSDILNELAALTASSGEPYVWRISPSKVFGMYQASNTAAPFNLIIPTNDPTIGDIEVEQLRQDYYNRIIVTVPSTSAVERTETFTGDGTTTKFFPQYTVTRTYGVVFYNGNNETLRWPNDPDAATWTFDPSDNSVTRTSAPANAVPVLFKFDGSYSGLGIAEDAGEIAAVGIYENVIPVDSVPANTTADAIAAGYLATFLSITQIVRYPTTTVGLDTGMVQTVTVAKRNINTTATISEIRITDIGAKDERLQYDVTATLDVSKTSVKKGWRDSIRQAWTVGGGGGNATAVTVGTTTSGGGPASPDESWQSNQGGAFYGKESFKFKAAANSLIAGGGGSSITASSYESCQVFGYDNHIADP